MELFARVGLAEVAPLAHRMRPTRLEDVVGQEHLTLPGTAFFSIVRGGNAMSLLLHGPPGCGKTSLSNVLSHELNLRMVRLNAALASVQDLRREIAEAGDWLARGKRTAIFVDEIHRFHKGQQDVLLPHAEDGSIVLMGATTENPSFALNASLLSRMRVFRLHAVSSEALRGLLTRAMDDERGLRALRLRLHGDASELLAESASGDVRFALSTLEAAAQLVVASGADVISTVDIVRALGDHVVAHDKKGDNHYDLTSAFIKSMRGTDPDAAIYYLMRMLDAGEDPRFVMRRMIIFASEDVGNADPQALQLAMAADQALQRLGVPEAHHAMAQCATYLASTVKSNAAYVAFTQAMKDVKQHGALSVPLPLRNAVSAEMRDAGMGRGYRYPHDEDGFAVGATYLPEALLGRVYYEPKDAGFEGKLRARLIRLRGLSKSSASEDVR